MLLYTTSLTVLFCTVYSKLLYCILKLFNDGSHIKWAKLHNSIHIEKLERDKLIPANITYGAPLKIKQVPQEIFHFCHLHAKFPLKCYVPEMIWMNLKCIRLDWISPPGEMCGRCKEFNKTIGFTNLMFLTSLTTLPSWGIDSPYTCREPEHSAYCLTDTVLNRALCFTH